MTDFWTLTAIVVLAPAFLIGVSPARWLGRVIILWLTSPLIGYFVIVMWESTTRPVIPGGAGGALLGLSIISGILFVPWLVVSIFGIVLGYAARMVIKQSRTVTLNPEADAINDKNADNDS